MSRWSKFPFGFYGTFSDGGFNKFRENIVLKGSLTPCRCVFKNGKIVFKQ